MQKNMSTADRVIRGVLAIALAVGAGAADGWLAVVLWVLAVIMAFTAGAGFCPLYRLFGMSTLKDSKPQQ